MVIDERVQSRDGFFDEFGGKFVAEVLRTPLDELARAFESAIKDKDFLSELKTLQRDYIGRPTPFLHAKNISDFLGGAQIYIKLEGLANTGAHKINNALGQCLLAKYMNKTRVIAETGAGQHGVATAAAAAKLGLECEVYQGEVDVARQQPNAASMELYGAKVRVVKTGSRTLKDAVNDAMRDWSASFQTTHYVLGSALGPAPFPDIVRTFQSVIGEEVKDEIKKRDLDVAAIIACVGGGSNAMGVFSPFIVGENNFDLIGVEAGGVGPALGENAIRMAGAARTGIVQGYKSNFLLNADGQIEKTRSISAGLDYPGIGPQLVALHNEGKIKFTSASDDEALNAVKIFAQKEGVLMALESAHAAAEALKLAPTLPKSRALVVNMSGRGDKDIFITSPVFRPSEWKRFLAAELKRLEDGVDVHLAKGELEE